MKVLPNLLAAAVLAALSAPAFADIEFDVIGGSEISFEGLIQADSYWYNNDLATLGSTGGSTAGDGVDTDFGMRRAELVFKGKGPGMWNWVVGYDARADKFLDTNISYNPAGWATVNPGYQIGSGMLMRFAKVDETGVMKALLDIYNGGTQMNDDNGQGAGAMRTIVDSFLDNAIGPQGYYGAFVVNMHSDNWYGWSYQG